MNVDEPPQQQQPTVPLISASCTLAPKLDIVSNQDYQTDAQSPDRKGQLSVNEVAVFSTDTFVVTPLSQAEVLSATPKSLGVVTPDS